MIKFLRIYREGIFINTPYRMDEGAITQLICDAAPSAVWMFTMIRKKIRNFSRMRMIALGFLIIILIGTLLLMTPAASRSREATGFLSALFTAVSSSCVTGLVVTDTYLHWSLFGQIIILILIQLGGLGFITVGFGFSFLLQRRISLTQRGLLKESVNVTDDSGLVKLAKLILKGTALIEGAGAVILSACFIPEMGLLWGIYYGIFHSVSAFCNAGFDLMSRFGYSSFTGYNDNPVVVITLVLLILTGGLGFFVWADLKEHKFHFRKYALHTKLVLSTSLILVAGGTIAFFFIERNNVFADMGTGQAVLNALFCAVTPRTAGFNMVDNGALSDAGKLLTIFLMFIGGCPGSTAGGIKVTTIAVIVLYLKSTFTRADGVNVFKRRLEDDAVSKATAVFATNFFIAAIAILILACTNSLSLTDLTFEAVSAISTVGMTTGITTSLNTCGKLIIALLMYLGRVGSLSFALSFTDKKKLSHIRLPKEHINIG